MTMNTVEIQIPNFLRNPNSTENAAVTINNNFEEIEAGCNDDIEEIEVESNDNTSTSSSPFTQMVIHKLKCQKLFNSHRVSFDSTLARKSFKSKAECSNSKENCIRKAYDEANSYFISTSTNALSNEAAKYYSDNISSTLAPILPQLAAFSEQTNAQKHYALLCETIDQGYKNLLDEYTNELAENQDYYRMYKYEYFIDQVEIEEHDYRFSDNFFGKAIETLFTDSIEYTLSNLHETIGELNNDLEDHANTFYNTAYNIYKDYVKRIEKSIDSIVGKLPESSFRKIF